MGHVKKELKNDGRGCTNFLYTPMSEPRIVKMLIEQRSRLDPLLYTMTAEVGIDETAGVYDTGDPVINTFIDLDRLIEEAPLTSWELYVVKSLMEGYNCTDITEKTGKEYHDVRGTFQKAVMKIVQTNNLLWEKCYADAPMSKRTFVLT